MTAESSENGAITMRRTNVSGYAGHAIIFSWKSHYCMLFSTRDWARIRFNVWLVSGYAHVFVLL